MSIHLPQTASTNITDSASSEGESDQTFDDWVSDTDLKQKCKSLFDDEKFDTVEQVVQHDKKVHQFDLDSFCRDLGLDFHGRVRLINYIRKTRVHPEAVKQLESSNPLFTSDDFLIPWAEDDPLLRIQSADTWDASDSEFEDLDDLPADPLHKIQILTSRLKRTQEEYRQYKSSVKEKVDTLNLLSTLRDEGSQCAVSRDDDTTYFESYADNDIHAVMISDKVRTSTYADYISSSSNLFMNATVLDVGCGTGILSLFAARAGAKRVIAVDASPIADKASAIVAANDLSDIITVIKGKVENLPDELVEGVREVDVIISEWMGYSLLYESMLDTVLCARDRWLKKADPNFVQEAHPATAAPGSGGVIVPSQCQMVLGLCEAGEIKKERIKFWDDVYGFNMSAMADEVYNDAVIDVVPPEALLSQPFVLKDLYLHAITPQSYASFVSKFTLRSTASKRTKISAFVLYFDTFFTSTGRFLEIEQSPGATTPRTDDDSEGKVRVRMISPGANPVVADVWPVGGTKRSLSRRREEGGDNAGPKAELRAKRRSTLRDKEVIKSFSTSPQSEPTHWKQTLFFLREPFSITSESVVEGTFYCKQSPMNSRELDIEIHYSVLPNGVDVEGDIVVQLYKVR